MANNITLPKEFYKHCYGYDFIPIKDQNRIVKKGDLVTEFMFFEEYFPDIFSKLIKCWQNNEPSGHTGLKTGMVIREVSPLQAQKNEINIFSKSTNKSYYLILFGKETTILERDLIRFVE